MRTPRTSAASSPGSSEQAWSGPGRPRSRVKCFSIRQAPRAAAASETSMPGVWSEKPTGLPKAEASVAMALRLASRGGAG